MQKETKALDLRKELHESVKNQICTKMYKSVPEYLAMFATGDIKERDPEMADSEAFKHQRINS